MALEISVNTQRALSNTSIEPTIAVKIQGVDFVFSSGQVKEYIKIGDPGLFIDGTWSVGGFRELITNRGYIDNRTTTFTIRQQINYDEGDGSSVSTMTIGMIDKDELISKLISPGFLAEDILGRKAQVFVGFGQTSFADDYIEVFKGFITKVQSFPGQINFTINHPDNKKKVGLIKGFAGSVSSNIQNSDLNMTINSTDNLLSRVPGVLETFVKINNEIIKYTVTSSTTASIVRAQLGTSAAIHDLGAAVESFYTLAGNPLDLALFLMLSGTPGAAYTGIVVESFVKYGNGADVLPNAIYFNGINLPRDFGVRAGDKLSITAAANAGNNVTNRTVLEVIKKDSGYYILIDGAALTWEIDSDALMSFTSQYNVLPIGMSMLPDEVDIDQHIFIRDFYHPATQMEFYITDDLDEGKVFLDDQIYKPIACYALPRKAKSSVGYSVGPIPGATIKSLSIDNAKNPKQAFMERTVNRSFFNEVVFKYDQYSLDTDKFLRGFLLVSQTSKNRIPGGSRTYKVESKGLRTSLNAQNIIEAQAQRIIDRYKFGAESFSVSALFSEGVDIEIGDVVVLEGAGLKITDITKGNRNFEPRLFEVRNKEMNLKTGDIAFELLDTGQNIATRFGLMSPVSKIGGVISQSQFVITHMNNYPSPFGSDEFRNWLGMFDIQDHLRATIRDVGYTFSESVTVSRISDNTFTLSTPAATTLVDGLVIELDAYNISTNKQKLIYAFYQDATTFADGKNQYSQI